MAMTMSGTTLTFNDSTTQTTAAGSTTFGAIGTIASVGNFSTSTLYANLTIAGSSLVYPSGTFTSGTLPQNFSTVYWTGGAASGNGSIQGGNFTGGYVRVGSTYNGTQFSDVVASGFSTLSGTWRIMGAFAYAKRYTAAYDGYAYTEYNQYVSGTLAMRIS